MTEPLRPRVLWRLLEQRAETSPGKTFLVSAQRSLTYAEAWRAVCGIARGLLARGVRPGDRVAMLTPPEPEFPLTCLACGMVGAVWFGINVRYTEEEVRHLVDDARPRVIITRDRLVGRDYLKMVGDIVRSCGFIEHGFAVGGGGDDCGLEPFDALPVPGTPDLERELRARADEVLPGDAALIVYTSGSTGRPKGAVLSHGSIIDNVAVQVRRFDLTADDRFLLHLPANHVGGCVEMLVGGLFAGCTLVLLDAFDVARLLETIAAQRVTALLQVPTLYLMMFEHPAVGEADLSSVRKLYWAGSSAPRAMVEAIRCRFPGARLVTGYGMSEVCGFATYTAPDDGDGDLMDTVGAVDPAFELRVVDSGRRPVAPGETGEVALRGAIVMTGYWGNPAATAEAIDSDGWYYTGDLGRTDARGYLTLVGRRKEMFVSGGFNVYPREVEIALEAHPDVALACVIGAPDPRFQEVGRAFVVPRPGRVLDGAAALAHCRGRLAGYKVPKSIEVRESLPMLGVGKVDRMALRAELGGHVLG